MKAIFALAAILSFGFVFSDYGIARSETRNSTVLSESSGLSPGGRDTALYAESSGPSPGGRDTALG